MRRSCTSSLLVIRQWRCFMRIRVMYLVVLSLTIAGPVVAVGPIPVDGRKQLFLDDYLIESMSNVQRRVETAQKYSGNPVLWATEPWEDKTAVIYGSVIRDGDK